MSRSWRGHPVHFARPIYSLPQISKVYLKRFWRERQNMLRRRTRRRRQMRRTRTENIKWPRPGDLMIDTLEVVGNFRRCIKKIIYSAHTHVFILFRTSPFAFFVHNTTCENCIKVTILVCGWLGLGLAWIGMPTKPFLTPGPYFPGALTRELQLIEKPLTIARGGQIYKQVQLAVANYVQRQWQWEPLYNVR